ncbi:MAG: tetratricopeptide repeat protein, partial [Gammaproteobacteria bacterium]
MLLLFVGYTWLSFYADQGAAPPDRTAVKKLSTASVNAEMLAAESEVEKQQQMPITRENDDDRAEAYMQYEAVEQQILSLLDRADVHFENGQFVSPAGENAWEDYQAILEIDPNESIAIAGLTKIKSRLIGNAEEAIDNGDLADAENWLVQLDSIQPGDPTQMELRQEISDLIAAEAEARLKQQEAEALQQKIETTLSQAAEEEIKNPINYNKILDLYNRVNELDPENTAAREGLERLSDAKLDEVEKWLREEKLELAAKGLQDVREIYPDNRRISGLQLALDASLGQKQQSEERERLAIVEEEERRRKQQEQQQKTQQTESAKQSAEERKATSSSTSQPVETLAAGVAGTSEATPEPAAAKSPESMPKQPAPSEATLSAGIKAYYNGDYNRSFELLYPLAQEGVPRAQFRIGIMYQFGRSVARNPDLAEKWFTAALPQLLREAQRGVPWAQTDLGTAYEFGISLQQDYERAAYWYQRAANQGYAGAQTNLGVLFAQGDGVPYDRAKAVDWFR